MESEVIEFVAEFTGVSASKITPDTLINNDLGVDGDDGCELLSEYSERFQVDISGIDETYFGPEGFSPFILIIAVYEFFAGLFGVEEKMKPLPVKQLIKSAEAGKWIRI